MLYSPETNTDTTLEMEGLPEGTRGQERPTVVYERDNTATADVMKWTVYWGGGVVRHPPKSHIGELKRKSAVKTDSQEATGQ